jgi:hypothetical protein
VTTTISPQSLVVDRAAFNAEIRIQKSEIEVSAEATAFGIFNAIANSIP